jgi:stage III sporulation protein SpoIIIAA
MFNFRSIVPSLSEIPRKCSKGHFAREAEIRVDILDDAPKESGMGAFLLSSLSDRIGYWRQVP